MYYHPADTCAIYEGLNKSKVDQLWYRVHYFQQKATSGDRKNYLESLAKNLYLSDDAKPYIAKLLDQRLQLLVKQDKVLALKIIRGKMSGRMVHGLGGAHVRETSITLHPVYGIPYIPASSIKGVVRNWALQAFFLGEEEIMQQEELSKKDQNIRKIFLDIFGDQDCAGRVEFFDAFADVDFSLKPDVMTPHFPDYYSSGKPPRDDQSPNPVDFYTLKSDYIEFVLGARRTGKNRSGVDTDVLLDVVSTWLENTLRELGIGSKNSSGYGYFLSFEDRTDLVLRKNRKTNQVPKQEKPRQVESQFQADKSNNEESVPDSLLGQVLALQESDREYSKGNIFPQVIACAAKGDLEPARALKKYWESVGEWKVKGKKKQLQKVQQLKKLLEEKK